MRTLLILKKPAAVKCNELSIICFVNWRICGHIYIYIFFFSEIFQITHLRNLTYIIVFINANRIILSIQSNSINTQLLYITVLTSSLSSSSRNDPSKDCMSSPVLYAWNHISIIQHANTMWKSQLYAWYAELSNSGQEYSWPNLIF